MKTYPIAFVLFIGCCVPAVQAIQMAEEAESSQSKRLAITAKQRDTEADFKKQEAECYKKFAVNSCLDKISAARRGTLAQLKEEVNLLNDMGRKDKGAQQLNKTRANTTPEKLQQGIDREMKSAGEYQNRIAQKKEQQLQIPVAAANKAKAVAASEKKRSAKQKQIQLRSQKEIDALENAKQFEQRQNASSQRRIQHEAEEKKRGKSLSKPLPLPASN